jgi:hypothetical protein
MNSKELIKILNYCGHEPRSYSGRGMYGKKCVGFVVGSGARIFNMVFELASMIFEYYEKDRAFKFLEDLSDINVETDSMGYDTIVYFPSMEWVEDEDEDEDEDE